MFEDSTFESNGRIHTRSRGWMIATFLLNAAILATLILIPLIYPEALPRQPCVTLLTAPPVPETPPSPKNLPAFHGKPEAVGQVIFSPPTIPDHILRDTGPEQAPATSSPWTRAPDSPTKPTTLSTHIEPCRSFIRTFRLPCDFLRNSSRA